jgi:cell division septation protein DedD
MAPHPFGLNRDPFDSAELELDEATLLMQARVSAAGGDEKLILPEATCAEIYQLARGKRGGVFLLAGRAMRVAAGAGATTVTEAHVHEAAAEAAQTVALQNDAAESARTIISAIDDVPDMPKAMGGGMMLPSEPSADLEPGQRDWVARFMSPSAAPRGLASLGEPNETPRPVKRVVAATPAPSAPVATPKPLAESKPAAAPKPTAVPKPPSLKIVPTTPAVEAATGEPTDTESDPAGVPPRRLSAETTARIKNSRGRRRGAHPAVIGGIAVIATVAIGAAVFQLATRVMNQTKTAKTWTAPAETISATSAPASTTPGLNLGAPATTPVEAPAVATPPPTPKKRAKPVETPPEEAASFSIELATYIDGDRANEERGRIAASGYSVRVINASEDSSGYYRLVAGPYPSRAAAEQAADAMLASGLVQQARVISVRGE